MVKAEFYEDKLHRYLFLLHEIVDTSIAVYDSRFVPVVETDAGTDHTARIENIKKRLPNGKQSPAIWFSSDETTEVAVPLFHEQTLFAYAWIGNLYFEPTANPHTHLMRENRPVYDRRSIRDIMEMIEFGVNLFLRDVYEIDPELHSKIDSVISANLDKKITFHLLSSSLGIDIKILRSFFNEELKCGLPDYQRMKKIEAAKQFLTETDLPFDEISKKIGMPEELWTRLFKKQTSMTPEEYRNSR